MAHRLRRRYGHGSRSHLPRSRLSLVEYERQVNAELGSRPRVRGEHERLEVLNGWRHGWQPITMAQSIAMVREKARR
jgi:hypothetical protein